MNCALPQPLDIRDIIFKLKWGADSEWSVPITPREARRLLVCLSENTNSKPPKPLLLAGENA